MSKRQNSSRESAQAKQPAVPKTRTDKKPYAAPRLFEFGSLTELTQVGPGSNMVHDHMGHGQDMVHGHMLARTRSRRGRWA